MNSSAWCDYSSPQTSTVEPKQEQALEDQCWYHSLIKRVEAVRLLRNEADFLVRDSISNPGCFVLTGLWHSNPVHFEINQNDEKGGSRPLFHFEDEKFASVVDLIDFYHSHRKEVTAASGFILGAPVVRKQTNGYCAKVIDVNEIEATYAPYLGRGNHNKGSSLVIRPLGHTALLNQTKKRLNEREVKVTGPNVFTRHISSNQQHTCNTKENFDVSQWKATKAKNNSFTNRIPPSTQPPAPPTTNNEQRADSGGSGEGNDYCEMDYDEMDALRSEMESKPPEKPVPIPQPDIINHKAVQAKKRFSEVFDAPTTANDALHWLSALNRPNTLTGLPISRLNSKSSTHLPSTNHNSLLSPTTTPPLRYIDSDARMDRAQSCHNLWTNSLFRRKQIDPGAEYSQRFPTKKIDPPPTLPSRSTSNLFSECNLNGKHDKGVHEIADNHSIIPVKSTDYDELSTIYGDYAKPSSNPKKPPTPPKPTLAKLKAMSQMSKELRYLIRALSTADNTFQLALWITEEDCKVFRLIRREDDNNAGDSKRASVLDVFIFDKAGHAAKDIADRLFIVQAAILTAVQKAPNPTDVLEALTGTAANLFFDLGNLFAFGNIMDALAKPEWTSRLSKMNLAMVQLLQVRLIPLYAEICNPRNAPFSSELTTNYLLPFIQPYLQFISSDDYVHLNSAKRLPSSHDFSDRIDLLCSFLKLARKMVCSRSVYEQRAQAIYQDIGSIECERNPFSNESLKAALLKT